MDASDARASDDERERVIERLRAETTAGRLTLDEFDERVGEVWASKTRAELQGTLRELPELRGFEDVMPDPPHLEAKARRRYRSSLRNELAGYVSTNALFGTIWWVNGADGRFWPMWILLPTTIGIVARLVRGVEPERRAVEEEWLRHQSAPTWADQSSRPRSLG